MGRILSDWKDKMIIARHFRSIQRIIPRISNEPTKISKMAEDISLCYCPKESDKIMEG
jgi:hypothetical protein